ncbi:MAG: hypothetical protein KF841_11640 [Phycisphaerae bacterium]|nr:hypothetical protein [Phycisphaerae bacterium]
MSLLLDGCLINDTALPDGSTVSHAIDLAKARLSGSGRLILGIYCNGAEVEPSRLRGILSAPYANYSKVELISGSPYSAVIEALNQARAVFAESFSTIKQVSAWLSSGDVPGAMGGLSQCVEAWSNMHEAVVRGGALVGVEFDRLVLGGRHVLDWLGDLNQRLRDIRDAIQSRDHVTLADVIRYELDEALQGWEIMLDGFIRHIEKLAADSESAAG